MMASIVAAAPGVPVEIKGLSWGSAGIFMLLATVMVALFKAWPMLSKLNKDADASLRHDLMQMVGDLRIELATERKRCEESETVLREEIAKLHGQIHELRNSMVELTLAASRAVQKPGVNP